MYTTEAQGFQTICDLQCDPSQVSERGRGSMPSVEELEAYLEGNDVSFEFIDGMIKAGLTKKDAFLLIERMSLC